MSASPSKTSLVWTRSDLRGGSILRLHGIIDETFDRKALVQGLEGTVVFDLEGVHRITSFGVREWVAGLRELKASEVVFIHARPPLVIQFNSVSNFAGGIGQLLSFYAPYQCPNCDQSVDRPVDLRADLPWVKAFEPPLTPCPICQSSCEFDDEPSLYFEYPSQLQAPQLSAVALALIHGTELPAPLLKIEKDVRPPVTALWLSGSLASLTRLERQLEGVEGDVAWVFLEVEDLSPENLAALGRQLAEVPVPIHLARAPLPVVEAKAAGMLPPQVHVVSVSLGCVCPTCHRRTLQEFTSPKTLLGPHGPPCAVDGALTIPEQSVEERQLLLKSMSSAPATIARYLLEHPGPGQAAPPPATMASVDAGEGEGLFGRYEMVRLLGRGGMAEVYLARQLSLGGFAKTVVVKRILGHLALLRQKSGDGDWSERA